MTRAESPTPCVGIDVSKATLDVAVGTEAAIWKVTNTP